MTTRLQTRPLLLWSALIFVGSFAAANCFEYTGLYEAIVRFCDLRIGLADDTPLVPSHLNYVTLALWPPFIYGLGGLVATAVWRSR